MGWNTCAPGMHHFCVLKMVENVPLVPTIGLIRRILIGGKWLCRSLICLAIPKAASLIAPSACGHANSGFFRQLSMPNSGFYCQAAKLHTVLCLRLNASSMGCLQLAI
jgi:hypothetical protein